MSADLSALVSRLEAVTVRLEAVGVGGGGSGEPSSEIVSDYENFISEYINAFAQAAGEVQSQDVNEAVKLVKTLVQQQKSFLEIASKSSEPSQADLQKLLEPMMKTIAAVEAVKNKTFKDREISNYTAAIYEGVNGFGWLTVSPTPIPFAKSCGEGAQFYTNRILKEQKHKDFCRKWIAVFQGLQDYIKLHHETGLTWNKSGPAAAPAAGGIPAPPPPPPPGAPAASASPVKAASDVSALLEDLNKGAAVTKGLKRVSDDMKTHKNPNLRLQSAVPYKAPAIAKKPTVPSKTALAKPPKMALEGKKWIVEHQKGRSDLVITDTSMKYTVYIFKCENSTIQVKGKVNSIILDNCKKTGVVFDSVVSGVEFVNCQSVQAQVKDKLPTANIEKTDGCILYLSKESMTCQIISAKSSEMNVSIPQADGDFKEYAICEQFRTVWNGKDFVTEPSENAE